jgi:fructose-1,6-bisphosphatase I
MCPSHASTKSPFDAGARSNRAQGLSEATSKGLSLVEFLANSADGNGQMAALGALLRAIAQAAIQAAELVSLGCIADGIGGPADSVNSDGDVQKQLDLAANDIFIEALRSAPVAVVLSEELAGPLALNPGAPLAVAIDPLDGSSNIDANVSIGTIFSVLPAARPGPSEDSSRFEDPFLRPGSEQLAAGFVIYGPQTSLVFTLGHGVHVFTLDRQAGEFRLTNAALAIPDDSIEYAVNASNYRHWGDSIRAYIDDCIRGGDGPLGRDHNMRWIASLVADAYRILVRGGVFLYPGDQRRGYANGRLRLIYEANPICFLVEQAGGSGTDTVRRILDIVPQELHARTPIIFGSAAAVERIGHYHTNPQFSAERAPLFFQRGLFRR